jgi:hypothetical protein
MLPIGAGIAILLLLGWLYRNDLRKLLTRGTHQ